MRKYFYPKGLMLIVCPFHEFDGDWFWWGKAHSSVADYKTLYQFTVTYLRDSLGVHNFLYAMVS
jgi:mannan endo-1,4-beta-mannosidase